MSNLITLDLARAVDPIQIHHDAIGRLPWKSTRHGFAVASLLTDGPKHVVMIDVVRDVLMTKMFDELKLWWEHSLVLVLDGLIENKWRKKIGNTGHYGWQKVYPNELAIFPPEGSHDRYVSVTRAPWYRCASNYAGADRKSLLPVDGPS